MPGSAQGSASTERDDRRANDPGRTKGLLFRRARLSRSANPVQPGNQPDRKAGMTQPNPLRYEEQVKQIFSPHNQFQNWIGTLRFSVVGKAVSIVFLPECGSTQQFIQFSNATPMPSGLITGMQPEDVGTIVHLNS